MPCIHLCSQRYVIRYGLKRHTVCISILVKTNMRTNRQHSKPTVLQVRLQTVLLFLTLFYFLVLNQLDLAVNCMFIQDSSHTINLTGMNQRKRERECVCVCVCVGRGREKGRGRERERERERKSERERVGGRGLIRWP